MKIWLDDVREAPDSGWRVCRWPSEVISYLERGTTYRDISHLSLDHDLGDDERGTGYDVLLWIEERVVTDPNYTPPPLITVHSANTSARVKMELAIDSIRRRSPKPIQTYQTLRVLFAAVGSDLEYSIEDCTFSAVVGDRFVRWKIRDLVYRTDGQISQMLVNIIFHHDMPYFPNMA